MTVEGESFLDPELIGSLSRPVGVPSNCLDQCLEGRSIVPDPHTDFYWVPGVDGDQSTGAVGMVGAYESCCLIVVTPQNKGERIFFPMVDGLSFILYLAQ